MERWKEIKESGERQVCHGLLASYERKKCIYRDEEIVKEHYSLANTDV